MSKPLNGPRYKIGQKVWAIDYNKILELTVCAVAWFKNRYEYSYELYDGFKNDDYSTRFSSKESEIFATKEELIASL